MRGHNLLWSFMWNILRTLTLIGTGGGMGSGSKNSRRPMAWQATLGGMVASGTQVRRSCSERGCGRGEENVDIRAMLEAEGPQATLWNRRPLCPHCGARGHYSASSGMVMRPLLSDAAWQEAKYQLLKSLGLTRLDIRRIQEFAERVNTSAPYSRGLSDLDAGVYVTARRMLADPIPPPYRYMGEWAGRDLLYREFNAAERDIWERRRGRPRPV